MSRPAQQWLSVPRYREFAFSGPVVRGFGTYLLALASLCAAFTLAPVRESFGIPFHTLIEYCAVHAALTALKYLAGHRWRGLPLLNPLFFTWLAVHPETQTLGWFLFIASACNDALLVIPNLWHAALLFALPLLAGGGLADPQALLIACAAAVAYGWLSIAIERYTGRRDESSRLAAERIRQEERERIAGDLHDGLGAIFTGITLRCRVAAGAGAGEARRLVEELIAMCDKALRKLRLLARSFEPEELTGDDLESLLRGLLAETAPRRAAFRLEGELPANLNREFVYNLLHLAGEATVNAVRHGQASFITVTLSWAGSLWMLRIDDNGRGVTPAECELLVHASALAIRSRRMGARMAVHGGPHEGTQLAFTNTVAEGT